MAWALIAGVLRAYFRTNEVISTLMLNFIALNLIDYLVVDTASIWRDPLSAGHPQGAPLPDSVLLPLMFDQADIGVLVAVVAAVVVWLGLKVSVSAYRSSIPGDSEGAARYAGVARRIIVTAFAVSGALCGLAGAIMVTNVARQGGADPRVGARIHRHRGGDAGAVAAHLVHPHCHPHGRADERRPRALELAGITPDVIIVLQGALLLLVVAGQFFASYRIARPSRSAA